MVSPGILRLIVFSALMFLPGIVSAQQDTWEPPIPDETKFVWIRLPSGEWLAGEINSLRDQSFDFESEELDTQTFDWADIKELRSPQVLTFEFNQAGQVSGPATISETTVYVRVGGEVKEFPRSNLLSIISGNATDWNFWSANASIGFVSRTGNTDQDDLNASVFIRRQATRSRLDLNYNGNFGTVAGTQTVNNHSGTGKFDWLMTQGFFVTPVSLSLLSDKFQNIDLRSTIGPGVGYFLVRTGDVEWSVNAGGGYQSTSYLSVQPGVELTQTTGILMPGTLLDMKLTGSLDLVAEYNAQIGLAEPKNTFHHSSVYFTLDALGDILEFTLRVTWDHTTNPQQAADGTLPKKNDLRTAFGIGVSL